MLIPVSYITQLDVLFSNSKFREVLKLLKNKQKADLMSVSDVLNHLSCF